MPGHQDGNSEKTHPQRPGGSGKKRVPLSDKKKPTKEQTKNKPDEVRALRSELKHKEKELEEIRDKMNALQEDYLRQMADKENLRKRLEREKQDFYKYALSEVLKEFIVILDNFERAVKNKEDQKDNQSFQKGIELIQKQYADVLKKQGVQPIEIKDNKFDPNMHQAFSAEESDEVAEPVVGEVYQRGYTLHGRLLRPALVKVITPKKDT